MSFYVYHLINPNTKIPFYVGKGKKNRMYVHERLTKQGKIPNNNRLLFREIKKILDGFGKIEYIKIKEGITENDALLLETQEIKKYGRRNNKTGILCNLTDGGEGVSGYKHTQMARILMSNSYKSSPNRVLASMNNFKIACHKNTGKRMLKKRHHVIVNLYKTHSIKKIQKILNVAFPTLKKYLVENGIFIKNKNRKDSNEVKLKKSLSNRGKRSRPVLQLDLNGEIIHSWENMTSACDSLGKPNRQGDIQDCCNGRQKTAFGYIWKYIEP